MNYEQVKRLVEEVSKESDEHDRPRSWAERDHELAVELAELYGDKCSGETREHLTVEQVLGAALDRPVLNSPEKVKAPTAETVEPSNALYCRADVRVNKSELTLCDERDLSQDSAKCSNSLPVFDFTNCEVQKCCITRTEREAITHGVMVVFSWAMGAPVTLEKISKTKEVEHLLNALAVSVERAALDIIDTSKSAAQNQEFALLVASELSCLLGDCSRFMRLVNDEARAEVKAL